MSNRNKDGKSEDLKNMLMSFRIAELQTLLASCGRSRSGRKHELMGRALNLLKSSSDGTTMRDRVKTRILELYHQRFPGHNTTSNYPQPYVQFQSEKDDDQPTYLNRPYNSNSTSVPTRTMSYGASHAPPTRVQPIQYAPPTTMPLQNYGVPINPDVRFIKLPFYDTVDVLIKPTSLAQKTLAGLQDMNLVYNLTPYQTQLITNSRSFNLKSVIEYGVQVQLRFCLAETSCVQEDLYPSRCKLYINGKLCPLPGQPPPNAQNQEPRKPHRPINITPFCRLSAMQSNNVSVHWMPSESGQRFAATVHLVRTVQTSHLISQLRQKPERSQDHTIAFIKEKLHQDPDSEIALTSLKVSLCCPIGRTRMTMPCRANNCNHLQCFDGSLYIQLNEKKPSWVCPVCDQKAHYDQLFVDSLFVNINKKCSDDDIVFFEDGSWRPLSDIQDQSKPLSQILNTPKTPKPSAEDRKVFECNSPSVTTPPPPTNLIETPTSSSCDPPPLQPQPVSVSEDAPLPAPVATNSGEPVEEEEAEVIIIDDSDSDDGVRPPVSTEITRPQAITANPAHTSDTGLGPNPFNDPDLQGLDLYNLLPHEDRIAAAMYLDQAGILGQLTNHHNGTSPTSVIDISDE